MKWIWIPDTCHCIAGSDDQINFTLIEKCRTHDTFREMKIHNNRPIYNRDIPAHVLLRIAEKAKPAFARR